MTMERSNRDLTPLTVSIGGFTDGTPAEDPSIRRALDDTLVRYGKFTCDVSALTIFPYKHWNRAGRPPRQELYNWYLKAFLPRLRARDPRNRNGTYFQRMLAFTGVKQKDGKYTLKSTNQLEHIIKIWHNGLEIGKRPRQSALQVACFDPSKDHTGSARSVFPCLQQVSFTYDDQGGLAVNAHYPTQYIFDRAYGNYLGLCHLGCFMAHELGLQLIRLNCFIARPELGSVPGKKLRELETIVREIFS